jgi:hypothetical protein
MFRIVYTAIIVVHAALGTGLFVVGFLALRAPKRAGSSHGRLGSVYFALLFTCLPLGLVIGAHHPGLSAFEVATPPTMALGVVGWLAKRRRPRPFLGRPWIAAHISGVGGSYIGVATAGAFQTFGRVAPATTTTAIVIFAVPTLIGSPLIRRATARRVRGARHPEAADGLRPSRLSFTAEHGG